MNDRDAFIALNMVPLLGPVRLRQLLAHFGSPQRVLQAKQRELLALPRFGPEIISPLLDWENHLDLSTELRAIQDRGLEVLTPHHPLWPEHFQHLHDPPLVLYVWGTLTEADRHAIAIVGSRRCTYYGLQQTKRISYQLAYAGYSIVSGLAKGIDTASHEGAIAANGRTLALLGSGLAQIYPAENLGLAERIADGHGAVLSEYPLQTLPKKSHFPQRNRLVASWNSGLLVTECAARSGALITANLANEQGKQIFALPGPVDRPNSQGCHNLIRQGATLVTNGADILDDLGSLSIEPPRTFQERSLRSSPSEPSSSLAEKPSLSKTESLLLNALKNREASIDDLIQSTSLPSSTITSTLLQLEIKSLIQILPGLRYTQK